jgi:hypothetical protein
MTMATSVSARTATPRPGACVGDIGLESCVHLLLERDNRGQHRLAVLLVLGVGQHATGALGLLLGAHRRFNRAQLVGRKRRRHRRRRGERPARFEDQAHRPQLGVGERLGLLVRLAQQVQLVLGGVKLCEARGDPLAGPGLVDLAPVGVEIGGVSRQDELAGRVGEQASRVREVDAKLAGLDLSVDGALLLADREADRVDASTDERGEDQEYGTGHDAERRLLHDHVEYSVPLRPRS